MLAQRKLALFLLASLGLNIFLAGILGGQLLSGNAHRAEVRSRIAKHERLGKTDKGKSSTRDRAAPPDDRKRPPHRDAVSGHHHGSAGPYQVEGPSDLFLLRQMIQIMGGPKDRRILRLREERKDEIHRIRAEMQGAHKRVHEALTSEKSNDAELQDALKNLRKTAFESQARAQEGILTLAKLMTPEERAELRKLPLEKLRGRKGPEGHPSPNERATPNAPLGPTPAP